VNQTLFAFDVSAETREAGRKAGNAEHYRRLQQVLGDGRDWEYRGECTDLGLRGPRGKCSCGHEGLRYLFTIHRIRGGGGKVIVGSTCIGHFHGANAEMVDAIQRDADRLEREAADRLGAARRATQNAEATKLLDDLNQAMWALESKLATTSRRVKWHVWADGYSHDRARLRLDACNPATDRHPCLRVKQYKRVSALIRNLKQRIQTVNSYLASPWE
jgi:hypothetical protein